MNAKANDWYGLSEDEIIELLNFIGELQISVEGDSEYLSTKRKIHWSNLQASFYCFFTESDLPNNWTKNEREFYTCSRDVYLSLYAVLRTSWYQITIAARRINFVIPKQPIEALIDIIDSGDILESEKCTTTNKAFSPSKFHRLGLDVRSTDRKNKVQQSNTIKKAWERMPDNIEAIGNSADVFINDKTTQSALARFQTQALDGYDLFLLEAVSQTRSKRIQVLTDDMDYATVKGIQVFTSNGLTIQEARVQNKLLVR